ncbi:transglycosylase SLT domain-containing protein [Streptomyces sp. NPDC058220]|uniref:transglycosylase SLT domain-containing protein n=1 Tax=Streptomyces sp. NPDC058220 TaxID=3346387 RepID=UPI0036E47DFE
MPAHAKHRRPRTSPLARRLVAAGTGGAALALPLVAATTAGAAPSAHRVTAEADPATAVAAQKDTSVTYVVVAGDSLSKIARAHSVSGGWQKLYQDNRRTIGDNPSLIRPGLKLTLGGKAESRTATTSAADQAATPAVAASAPVGASSATVPVVATAEVAPEAVAPAEVATEAVAPAYTNDLDGWIKESLDVMAAQGIPGSYDGIYRNIMRESSGNPLAINNWDSNAAAGTPSKGLLQVIDPTFQAYHVPGTSMDSYDPVANITAACNYAADRYGSIDNVNGPY